MSTLDHKERIIQAAYSIGARGGLAAISARAVAEDAGVSVGYLYKLFPSKSDTLNSHSRESCAELTAMSPLWSFAADSGSRRK